MLRRLQFTIDILSEQINNQEIESELIIVEWNPVVDKPRLSEALQFSQISDFLTIRIIEVPSEIHRRYKGSDAHPMHVAAAFNAGLFRARGEFSVIRMSDVIWSTQLLEEIANKSLTKGTKYRCTRVDVDSSILDIDNTDSYSVEKYCESHIKMVMKKMRYHVSGLPPLRLNSDGDFQMISTDCFRELRGYLEIDDVNSANVDGLLEHCAYAAGLGDEPWENYRLYKIDHGGSYKNRVLPSVIPFYKYIDRFIPLFLVGPSVIKLARMSGLTRIFYDKSPINARGMKVTTREDYFNQCRRIVSGEEHYVLNSENWGLQDEELRETYLMRATWDK